jgi:hypothetical protein
MKIDSNKYLGILCKRGHEYKNTGRTLRYKINGNCIECHKVKKEQYKLNPQIRKNRKIHIYRNKKKEVEARKQASLNCPYYQDCLDKVSRRSWGGGQIQCHKCNKRNEFVENIYKKEIVAGDCARGFDEMTEFARHN